MNRQALPAESATAPWRARALGDDPADLDIDFTAADRATTVTSLLAACVSDAEGHRVAAEAIWDWTLNQRLQALIAMRLADGAASLEIQAPCTRCGEAMGITLDLQAFAGAVAPPRFEWRSADGAALWLRLPSGRDLQRWRAELATAASADADAARAALLASLIESVDGHDPDPSQPAPTHWLAPLDDAFDEHDPLTALHLQASCPACAQDNRVDCDLEALIVDGFAHAQARLLDDVFALAGAFHWSETQIMALPRWRRAHYLGRLDAGDWA